MVFVYIKHTLRQIECGVLKVRTKQILNNYETNFKCFGANKEEIKRFIFFSGLKLFILYTYTLTFIFIAKTKIILQLSTRNTLMCIRNIFKLLHLHNVTKL